MLIAEFKFDDGLTKIFNLDKSTVKGLRSNGHRPTFVQFYEKDKNFFRTEKQLLLVKENIVLGALMALHPYKSVIEIKPSAEYFFTELQLKQLRMFRGSNNEID